MSWMTWVAARPDGALLGIGDASGEFTLWDLRERAPAHRFSIGDFVVRARWSSDGQKLLACSRNGTIFVRSGDGRSPLGEIQTGHGRLYGLALRPDGTAWATCGSDRAIRIWDPETLRLRLEIPTKYPNRAVGFAKGSIVYGDEDGYFTAKSEDGKEQLAEGAVVRLPAVYSLAVHPSGERVVFGGGKGGMQEVRVGGPGPWRAGTAWKHAPPNPVAVNSLEFAPDGRFAAAFSDGSAMLFDSTDDTIGRARGTPFYLMSPKPAWREEFVVSGACFVPGTELLATSHFDGAVRLWKGYACVETIRPREAVPEPPPSGGPLPMARSSPECRLYMELRPCACGRAEPPGEDEVLRDARGLVARYEGRCPQCGAARKFEFELDPETVPPDVFGGSRPSRMICPGQFALHSDRLASRWPARPAPPDRAAAREDLFWAVRALEEVLKFVPAGGDAVPAEAFSSEEGRAAYAAEPGRFRAIRLRARLGAYRETLASLDRPG